MIIRARTDAFRDSKAHALGAVLPKLAWDARYRISPAHTTRLAVVAERPPDR